MTHLTLPEAIDRDWCVATDRRDPLGHLRERVLLGPCIYLDGNSLGPPASGVETRLRQLVGGQWREDLVRSWLSAGWMDSPLRVGDRLGGLLGASPGQVVVADTTTINLHKLLLGALAGVVSRRVVLTESENFHSDLYAAAGSAGLAGGEVRLRPRTRLLDGLDESVAVLLLTHVDFRSAEMHEMRAVTAAAHDVGAMVLWDLSHSVGAVPLRLDDDDVDLAVGCTYKYLNGGPGSPAFLYVAGRHQHSLESPLSGWLGHQDPFAFEPDYVAATGVRRFLVGSPPVLHIAALDAALDAFEGVDMVALRCRSLGLTELFIRLVDERCAGRGLELATPREGERRGSHVSLRHGMSYAVVQALIARGVVGDFREPDLCRFGFAPLYTSHAEVWDAVEQLRVVLDTGEFRQPGHAVRAAIT